MNVSSTLYATNTGLVTYMDMTSPRYQIQPDPPSHLNSDYLHIAVLIGLFLIGAPVNLNAFAKLNHSNESGMKRSGSHLLKFHLNLCDLSVIFIYTTGKICWLITYQWRGGEPLCRLMMFLSSTSFQLVSNVIVCIALDRVFLVIWKRRTATVQLYNKITLTLAWLTAGIVNVPQLFNWTVLKPYDEVEWEQCVTIWFYRRYEARLYNTTTSSPLIDEHVYNFVHLIAVFWLPLTIIALCYCVVCVLLRNISNQHHQYISAAARVSSCQPNEEEKRRLSKRTLTSELMTEDGKSSMVTDTSATFATAISVHNEVHKLEKKTIKTNALLILAYVACWLPYNMMALWSYFDYGFKSTETALRFIYHLIVLNSVINPILYGMISCFPRANFHTV